MQSYTDKFSSVQSLSHVWFFATPWTAARQASLSITSSWSWLKFMFIEWVMPSNHLILCHPLLLPTSIFPRIRVFSKESVLCMRCQSVGVSASASVLSVNIQDWFRLGWTGWISLQSKRLSRVFSNTKYTDKSGASSGQWAFIYSFKTSDQLSLCDLVMRPRKELENKGRTPNWFEWPLQMLDL